jgi:hypothetical protein
MLCALDQTGAVFHWTTLAMVYGLDVVVMWGVGRGIQGA